MPTLLQNIQAEFSKNNFKNVIQIWNISNSLSSLEPFSAKLVAFSFFQLNEYESAFKILEDIESCFQDDITYLSVFGVTCRRLSIFPLSERLLSKSVELDPSSLGNKNNLANLLIDLHRFEEAQVLLDSILTIDPDFKDAIHNLQRLETVRIAVLKPNDKSQSSNLVEWSPADPLLLAFSPDEVQRSCSKFLSKKLSSDEQSISEALPTADDSKTLADQLKLAAQANAESNYKFALTLCTCVYNSGNSDLFPDIYEIAADAYVGLKLFRNAEVCFLSAASQSGFTFKYLFNLCSLSLLRKDVHLAKSYLHRARSADPDNPNLTPLAESVFNSDHKFSFSEQWDTIVVESKQL